MIVRSATGPATPDAVWALLARPSAWHRWAPQVHGAWGLGAPEVQSGRRGVVRVGLGVPVAMVPVQIIDVVAGRQWSWRVAGMIDMDHRVEPVTDGSRVTISMSSRAVIEATLLNAYAPLVARLLERLVRVAALADGSTTADE